MPEVLTQEKIVLEQWNPDHEGLFESQHWVKIPVADGRHLLTTAGIVILKVPHENEGARHETELYDYGGITSDEWRRNSFEFGIDMPAYVRPAGKVFKIEQWAPFITINAIYNEDQSINAGWAVDGFDMILPDNREIGSVRMAADIAVRDSDGILYRIGYSLTMSGQFVDASIPAP